MKLAFRAVALAVVLLCGCAKDIDPVVALPEARALLAQGKSGEARILLKNLLSRYPGTSQARVLLARIALDDGNAKAAGDELSALDATALNGADAVQLRARVDIETDRPEAALQRLQASGELVPQPDRAILIASAYRASGSPADALATLREIKAPAATSEPVVLAIAEAHAAMGNMELAAAELDRYLASSPRDSADALRMRGDVQLRQGNPAAAAADFHAALVAAPPGWPRIMRISTELMVADALIAEGQVEAAKVQLAKVEKFWPGTLGAMVLQGQVALLEGRPEEAAERLGAVMDAGAGSERVQYLLVEALMKSGNAVRANELLEQLVAAEPVSSPERRLLAAMFMQQGRPDRVIEILGDDAELGIGDGAYVDDDLLTAARLARDHATMAISSLSARLDASPWNVKLRIDLAAAQLANGEPAAALETLGRFVEGRQDPVAVATRLSALYATGDSMEANNVVDMLLNSAGADLPVLLAATDAASQRRQNAAVSRLLGRAADLGPTSAEVLMRRANLAFAERKYDAAATLLNDILQREPGNAGAELALARVAEARGDVAGSRKALESAVAAHPAAMEPSLMLASLELRASKVEAASNVLDRLISANADAAVPNAAGLLLARAGRHEEARTRFRQAIDREDGNAEYWYNLGDAQLALHDPASAQQSFLRSAELQPDSLRSGISAVRLCLEQNDVKSARRVAGALAAKLPGSSTSWMLVGEADAAAGDNAAAGIAFSRSYAERASSLAATRTFEARVAAGAPRPEEPLLKWLAREPTDTVARLRLADFHLRNGRDAAARDQLEIIVGQSPNDLAALNNLAWVLRSSAPDRAESLAKRARAIAPDNSAVADTLGVILLANGKAEEAVQALAQAATGLPQDQTVQYHYASSLSKVGQKDKARGILENVLKDQQGFPERAAAQRLFEELG